MEMIYLDNSATTKPFDQVKEYLVEVMEVFGNPSSVHALGLEAEQIIKKNRKIVADSFDVSESEVFFTSCATESNNTAILGVAYANMKRGKHLISSKIEHPSVLEVFKKLELEGFRVTYLDVDSNGIIDMKQFGNEIDDETTLVSIMAVNNEIGSIQPIDKIVNYKKKYNFTMHVDAVQGYLKIPMNAIKKADVISISGHKFNAIKGIGGLIVKKGTKIKPLIVGGGQESDFRSGTENILGIAAMGKAIETTKSLSHKEDLRKFIIDGLSDIDGVTFNGYNDGDSSPYILSMTVKGIRGEVFLHLLEQKGVYVSTGSACHSNKFGLSHVLNAIGLDRDAAGSTIRISLGAMTTEEELKQATEIIKESIKELRR